MAPLQIEDITTWLQDNRKEYLQLQAKPFPPLGNELYFIYGALSELMESVALAGRCSAALEELQQKHYPITFLVHWCEKYQSLGAEDLVLFQANYTQWDEELGEYCIKVRKGIYVEREPFAGIISFCRVFELLYWTFALLEREINPEEEKVLGGRLRALLSPLA